MKTVFLGDLDLKFCTWMKFSTAYSSLNFLNLLSKKPLNLASSAKLTGAQGGLGTAKACCAGCIRPIGRERSHFAPPPTAEVWAEAQHETEEEAYHPVTKWTVMVPTVAPLPFCPRARARSQ